MLRQKKIINKILIFSLLLQSCLVQSAFADARGTIAIICDTETCQQQRGELNAYANKITGTIAEYAQIQVVQSVLELDYQRYGAETLDDLPTEMLQIVVKDLVETLENLYRAEGLLGVILVGRVPVPDVDYNGNVFKSMYPYMDFDDKAFLYDEKKGHFASTGSVPKAEVWSGVIREADGTNLSGFLTKAISYHSGGVQVEKRMFYEHLPELQTLKENIRDRNPEEKKAAWEAYLDQKEAMIAKSGRWMTANRQSDGYDEDGNKTEPFEPELGDIDISEDVLQYFRKEIDQRKGSYEVAFNIPKHIIEYMGLPPSTSPFGYTPRPTEYEEKMNLVLKDLNIPPIIYFCLMWGAHRVVVPSKRSQWTFCTETGSGFPFGNYRSDLFGCTDASAWWALHNLVAQAGSSAAIVVPKKGEGTISIGARGGDASLLEKKATIVKPGDVIYPGGTETIYYWDDPDGIENTYEQGFDERFEDLNGDGKYQAGEEIDKGNNGVVDMPEEEDYKKHIKSVGFADILVIYLDDSWHTLPEDTRDEGMRINTAWDPFPEFDPFLPGAQDLPESGGGDAASTLEEFMFWTELFYMSWDDAEKLLAQIGTPTWGKYEADEASFELHYLVGDYGDKYFMMAKESTNHRADGGWDPPLYDCEFEDGCSEIFNGWSFFLDGMSKCFKDRKKLGTIVLQIAEGWRAGWLENKTPESSFGAYAIANGTNLAFLARTVEPAKMTVDEGKINIMNDTGEVMGENTSDITSKIGTAMGGGSNALQGKLGSVLSGGGAMQTNPAENSSSGFSSDPFILSFAAGMPIGEALRLSGWDTARILYGDPTLRLAPVEQD